MTFAATVMMLVALSVFAFAAAAHAIPADSTVVSATRQSVSGAEIASGLLKNLDKVALGSDGATFTLNVEGTSRDISLDVGDIAAPNGGPTSGLAGIGIIAALCAGVFRAATLLLRLMR